MAFLGNVRGVLVGLVPVVLVMLLAPAARGIPTQQLSSLSPRQSWPDPEPRRPSERSCIERSFSNPGWHIFSPALVSVNASNDGTQGDLRFLAVNTATGISSNCSVRNIELDPRTPEQLDVWYDCNIPDLQFQFSLTDFEMRMRGSWVCKENSKYVSPRA